MKLVMTKQRKEIITIINNASSPITLKDIYKSLSNKDINLTTVYRTIEALLVHNLIKVIYINKASYYYSNQEHHHYMVCLKCNNFFNIPCSLVNINNESKTNFVVENHDLILYGRCKKCM